MFVLGPYTQIKRMIIYWIYIYDIQQTCFLFKTDLMKPIMARYVMWDIGRHLMGSWIMLLISS